MSRARRLLELLEILRRNRYPITSQALATELGISARSVYRDIATLQAQGARIDGAPGLGYILKPGFTLPPLRFQGDEIEALVLGARWVMDRADENLSAAAKNTLAKISAVLPPKLRDELDGSALIIGPGKIESSKQIDFPALRQAIRLERKIELNYRDANDKGSLRIIWPIALAYFDNVRMVVSWCELRNGFRNFRTDRIDRMEISDICYPRKRQILLEEWRKQEGIDSL